MRLFFGLCLACAAACSTKEAADDSKVPEDESACESVCDDAHEAECESTDGSFYDHASCTGTCTTILDMQEDTERCHAASDAWFACVAAEADVCLGFELDLETYEVRACNAEYEAYFACVADYCDDHEQVDYCN